MATAPQTYNYQQLQQLWIQAGGSPEWAPTMAAIAYGAESGGNPTATNPSGATGLWQIEVPGSSGGYTAAQLMDPLTNAKRAVELLGNGSGISTPTVPSKPTTSPFILCSKTQAAAGLRQPVQSSCR